MATLFELEFESTSEVGAQNVSLGYLSQAGDLLYQTANYNPTGRPYEVVASTSGDNKIYKRTTKAISPTGVVSNSTEQDVVFGIAGLANAVLDVKNIPGTPYIQAIQFQGHGNGSNSVAWVASGVMGPTITPAFGTNHYQTAGGHQREFIYVSGYGVFGFQAGSTGSNASSCAIARYDAVLPDSMPASVPSASVEVSSTDAAPGNRMAGKDGEGNIYCIVTIGGGGNRFLRSYTPALALRWSFALPSTHPAEAGGSPWGSLQDAVVIGNGNLLVVTNRELDGQSIFAFQINPDAGDFTFLGSQQITDTDSAADIASIVDECHVWYYRIPSLWRVGDCFVVVECGEVGIDQILYDRARHAGIPGSRINVAALVPTEDFPSVPGIGLGRTATGRTVAEILQRYAFFDLADIGGRIVASRRDRLPDGVIGGEDLRGHVYGDTPPTLANREREEDYELPRAVRVSYSNTLAEYEPGAEGYGRRITDAEGVVDIDLTAIAMDPDRAAAISEIAAIEQIVHREGTQITLAATDANKALKPGDIKTLDVRGRLDTIWIEELGYVYPGLMKLKLKRHDPSIYHPDAVGAGRRLVGSPIFSPGPTAFALLDAPLVREFDDHPGYFVAMGGNPTVPGLIEGWPGGDLQRREPAGWEDIARILRPGSVLGIATSALGDGDPWVPLDQTLTVTVNGELEPATLQEISLGANLAALECTGGWELIRFMTATFDAGTWTLGGLVRGVHGTEWATALHSVGNRFILLTGVAQILASVTTELNLSRLHNAATLGQGSDPVAEVSFAWTGVDRIPYSPIHLAAERDGNDIVLTWFRRDRIGKELQSGQTLPMSEASEAYEADIYDTDGETVLRTLSVSTPTATYTEAQQTTDFGSLPTELDWDVRQIGALGRGYANRITSEGL